MGVLYILEEYKDFRYEDLKSYGTYTKAKRDVYRMYGNRHLSFKDLSTVTGDCQIMWRNGPKVSHGFLEKIDYTP